MNNMFNDRKLYLEHEIKPIMSELTHRLALEQPNNPTDFILEILKGLINYSDEKLSEDEIKELNILRKKVIEFRIKEEMESPMADESGEFFEDKVKVPYEENSTLKSPKQKRKHRAGVSAEVYGKFNKRETFVPKFSPKRDDQIERIKNIIITSFLFRNLEENDVNIIIYAMEEKTYHPGEYVIKQNDSGDCLFIVEEGELDCFKTFSKNPEPVFLKKYFPGDSFGELALLYNTPRAASIISTTDTILWTLDRETFNHIIKDSARKKREKYESFLRSVEILSTVDDYELCLICDALKIYQYKAGDFIIKEVNIFYL